MNNYELLFSPWITFFTRPLRFLIFCQPSYPPTLYSVSLVYMFWNKYQENHLTPWTLESSNPTLFRLLESSNPRILRFLTPWLLESLNPTLLDPLAPRILESYASWILRFLNPTLLDPYVSINRLPHIFSPCTTCFSLICPEVSLPLPENLLFFEVRR